MSPTTIKSISNKLSLQTETPSTTNQYATYYLKNLIKKFNYLIQKLLYNRGILNKYKIIINVILKLNLFIIFCCSAFIKIIGIGNKFS